MNITYNIWGIISRPPFNSIPNSSNGESWYNEYIYDDIIYIAALFIVAGVVAVNEAERRIPVQYAKRVVMENVWWSIQTFR